MQDKRKINNVLTRICILSIIVCSIMFSGTIVASAADVTPSYNVTIDAFPMVGDVRAGNSSVYNITVNNTGNARGNYTLNVSDSDITNFSSVLDNVTMQINNGSSARTILKVSAKTGITVGMVDITTVSIKSVENPIYTKSAQVKTTVNVTKHNPDNKRCADCHADPHKGLGSKLQQSGSIVTSQQQGIVQKAMSSGMSSMATSNVVGNINLIASMGQDWYQQGIFGPSSGNAVQDKGWGWTFFDESPPSGYILPPEKVNQKNNIYALLLDDGNNSNPITGASVTANVTYWIYDGITYTSHVNSVGLVEDADRKGFYNGSFYFYGGTTYDYSNMQGCDGCHAFGTDTQIGYFPGNYTVSISANADNKMMTKTINFDVTPWGCENCHGSGNQHKTAWVNMDSACYVCHSINDLTAMGDAGNPHQDTAHRGINCIDCHTNRGLNSQTFNGVTFINGGMNNAPLPQYNYNTISLNKGTHSNLDCTTCHGDLTLPSLQGGYNPSSYAINGVVNKYDPSFASVQQFLDYYVIDVTGGGPLNISFNWEGTSNLGFYLYPPNFNPRNFTGAPYYDGSTFTNKPEIYANGAPMTGKWILQIYGYNLRSDWIGELQSPINYTVSSTYPVQKKDLPKTPECNSCHNSAVPPSDPAYTKDVIPNWNPGFAHADTNGDGKLDVQCRMCHNSMHNITIKTCQNCHTSAPDKHPIQDPSFSLYTPKQCLGCHGDPHAVSVQGSGDCVSCHDVTVGAITGALINASAMNTTDSIHKDLNKDATLVETANPANKKCWACHGNGSEPTGHPANFKSPATCIDCHAGNNTNFTPSNTILKVSEHYWNGDQIKTQAVSSCYVCHNKSEMLIAANDPDQGLGDINGGINGGNNSTSHYGKKRSDLLLIKDTKQYCDYCHNLTTSPSTSFSDVFLDINNTNIQNHSAYGTNPKCQDCHNTGRIHNASLDFQALTLPNSTFCLTCHGPGGTASIKDKSKHNNTLDCSVCHLDFGKGIHPMKYRNSSGILTLNRADGIKCIDCHESGLYGAPVIGKVRHTNNVQNGSLWDLGRASAFWDGNSTNTECLYCHGNTKHNATAIGKIDMFKGTNTVNVFGNWCGTCHYQNNGQYGTMVSIMSLLVPPEISKHVTYGNYPSGAGDGTPYFNHSLSSYDDNKCKNCHYAGAPTNLTQLMHNVSTGGTSCMGCHPEVDATKLGRHVNVSTSEGAGALSDNDCKTCHFNVLSLGQMVEGYANHSNTYFCQDCHTTAGTGPVKPTDPALIKDGAKHGAGNCENCHIAGDNEQRPLPDAYKYHTNGPKGPANGKNCYSCHYRSDGTGNTPDSATTGLNDHPFNAPGEDHKCNYCHDVYGNTVRPTLTGNGVDGCPDCHSGSSVHNVAHATHQFTSTTTITMSGVTVTPASAPAGTIVNVGATISGGFVQVVKTKYRIMNSAGTVEIRPWADINASFRSRSGTVIGGLDTTGLAAGTYKVQVKGMASGFIGGSGHNEGLLYYPDNGVWTSTTTVTLTVTSCSSPFSDVSCSHWAYPYIMYLYSNGVVSGYPDGTFRPDNTVTRAEFAVMMTRARGLTYTGGLSDFPDVPPSHWAYPYVMAAKQAGIISGYPDGTFRPDNLVSRAEIAVMIRGARGWTYTGGLSDFSDVPPSHWAYPYVMAVKQKGVVSGYPDGTFRPDNSATRAESSVMVKNMMTAP
jgi:hypothetical protein